MLNGPSSANKYNPSLFLSIDYWLLHDLEPNLDLLTSPTDAEMLESCAHWPQLCDSMRSLVERAKGRFDSRYFALWPRILELVSCWEALPEDLRQVVATNLNEAGVKEREDVAALNASLKDDLTSKGMTFNEPDPASFRQKLADGGFYAEWKGKYGDDAWAILEKAVGTTLG